MRLVDEAGPPRRHVWIADLNARYTLRNLQTLIAAVKAQRDYTAADRNTVIMMTTMLAAPALGEFGIAGPGPCLVHLHQRANRLSHL
jgi:hypothetical protein